MGKTHAIALRSVATVFTDVESPVCECLVDADPVRAEEAAASWGFNRSSDDWEAVCNEVEIDVVDICTPNYLHKEMALAAIAAGKHVYCEKPLGLTGVEAGEIFLAARNAGVKTAIGFNYICNPILQLARSIIESGDLGELERCVEVLRGTDEEGAGRGTSSDRLGVSAADGSPVGIRLSRGY